MVRMKEHHGKSFGKRRSIEKWGVNLLHLMVASSIGVIMKDGLGVTKINENKFAILTVFLTKHSENSINKNRCQMVFVSQTAGVFKGKGRKTFTEVGEV